MSEVVGGWYWASDVYDLEFNLALICTLCQRRYRTTLSVCQSNAPHSTSTDAVRIESSLDCVNATVNAKSSPDNTGDLAVALQQSGIHTGRERW